MDFFTSFRICGSGLEAQRAKMDVVVSNLANVNTTKTPEGGPYKRKVIVLSTEALSEGFESKLRDALKKVQVEGIVEDPDGLRQVYEPNHPHANEQGFVAYPNVNVVSEMADMITANRAYEASVTAFDATKNMAIKTLDIGK
ncbi:MAG TPA: flagellar basal body rod protein FlgC [Syntrophales bacterium]|mgnify:CR=1 FL=1|jgi:flagellar basal-body rod protein FlgC|nr:flagellar basal body rod protein FlgC [Syntrophales bacterium]